MPPARRTVRGHPVAWDWDNSTAIGPIACRGRGQVVRRESWVGADLPSTPKYSGMAEPRSIGQSPTSVDTPHVGLAGVAGRDRRRPQPNTLLHLGRIAPPDLCTCD